MQQTRVHRMPQGWGCGGDHDLWLDHGLRHDACVDRELGAQLQQAKTPESGGKARLSGRPRLWSVAVRLTPAEDGPHFCRRDDAQTDCLVATVAPGSLDGRSYAFDKVRRVRCRCWVS